MHSRAIQLAALALCSLASTQASSQTDEIQVYDGGIAGRGVLNLTWHNNYVFEGSGHAGFPGGLVANHLLSGVTEWALGVRPWMEAGLYLPLYSLAPDGTLTANGFKLRALFVSPDSAYREFFYGINFEFSYNAQHWDTSRLSQEIRPIVGWHMGAWDVVINPILDNSYKGIGNLDFAPASRIAFHAGKTWTFAVEEYDNFGPLSSFYASDRQTHQAFAAVDYAGPVWEVEAGAGFGLNDASDRLTLKLILSRNLD